MKIWKHYFFSFIKTVLYVLCLILILYFIITYIENSLYYFKSRPVSPEIKFLFYFWQIPDIGLQILPFAVLISGVILHWAISRSGEISALRSAGMSLWRISFPLICGAFFYVIVQLSVSEFVRPYAFKNFYKIKNNFIERSEEKNNFIKTTWLKSNQGILHFEEYNADTKTLKNAEFFEYMATHPSVNQRNDTNVLSSRDLTAGSALKLIVRSETAFFDNKKNTWVLHQASITNFENPQRYETLQVSDFETDVHFAPPKILRENVNSNELSYFDLSNLIHSAKRAHINVTNRMVDLYSKISLPFANLLFLLFTIPFALQRERQEASYFSILICLSLTASYWFGNLALKNLAVHGILSPIVAAWTLNIIFALIAIIGIAKLDKPA